MQMEWTFNLRMGLKHDPVAKVHVSYCPALDLVSQGRTEDEARRAIRSAVQLYVSSHYKRGTLDETLKELGFVEVNEATDAGVSYEEDFKKLVLGHYSTEDVKVPIVLGGTYGRALGSGPKLAMAV